ncbi:Prp42p [Sugiyamaella lignohabitans]|uniref:Prp42p n=1 Tax=Sugiyamaella lignohabitans TaxID=796027 RepID=A0A167D4T7_9ASCO|nr:Prp42p [Sugiyamaella lignohabitans]ANB12479.1 Prp42p [Sugiyamaella lignohabitans]
MSNGFSSHWHKLYSKIEETPDELEYWEDLVEHVESDEFGISRGSDEDVFKLFRFSFDGLLEKYPLLFGYWIRYAEQEFQLGNTERSGLVYERAVAACPYSVDLWVRYCQFCIDTFVRDESRVRLVFERAIELVGSHFLSHSLWDLYLNYEENIMESPKEVIYKILAHIVTLPIHQYSRYFARYRLLTPNISVELTAPEHVIEQFRAEYELELEEEKLAREADKSRVSSGPASKKEHPVASTNSGSKTANSGGSGDSGGAVAGAGVTDDMDDDENLYGDDNAEEDKKDSSKSSRSRKSGVSDQPKAETTTNLPGLAALPGLPGLSVPTGPANQRGNTPTTKTYHSQPNASVNGGSPLRNPKEDLRMRVSEYHLRLYKETQLEVSKRFTYESQITRHYFHVAFVDESQRVNWNRYLDFEEIEGHEDRIMLLYERALIPLGLDESLWFRYVRWLIGTGKTDEAINTLHRACLILPIGRPDIRYYFATVLLSQDLYAEAQALVHSVLQAFPSIKAINLLTSIIIKTNGLDQAIDYLKSTLESLDSSGNASNPEDDDTLYPVGIIKLISDLYTNSDRIDEARSLFEMYSSTYSLSPTFWRYYMTFELTQAPTVQTAGPDPASALLLNIQTSGLSKPDTKTLMQMYMTHLLTTSTKPSAVAEYMSLDRSIYKH